MLSGTAKFARSQLVITFIGPCGKMRVRVEIPYRTIDAVVTEPYSLTLTLWEAPRFFRGVRSALEEMMQSLRIVQGLNQSTQTTTAKSRLVELPYGTANHSDVIGQCLVYHIDVDPREFHPKVDALRNRDLLSISSHTFCGTPLSNPSMADGMRNFVRILNGSVTSISFDVRFQLQALVQNGHLLPWTADLVIRRLLELSRQAQGSRQNGSTNRTTQVRYLSPTYRVTFWIK
jgi:hypothetical protein